MIFDKGYNNDMYDIEMDDIEKELKIDAADLAAAVDDTSGAEISHVKVDITEEDLREKNYKTRVNRLKNRNNRERNEIYEMFVNLLKEYDNDIPLPNKIEELKLELIKEGYDNKIVMEVGDEIVARFIKKLEERDESKELAGIYEEEKEELDDVPVAEAEEQKDERDNEEENKEKYKSIMKDLEENVTKKVDGLKTNTKDKDRDESESAVIALSAKIHIKTQFDKNKDVHMEITNVISGFPKPIVISQRSGDNYFTVVKLVMMDIIQSFNEDKKSAANAINLVVNDIAKQKNIPWAKHNKNPFNADSGNIDDMFGDSGEPSLEESLGLGGLGLDNLQGPPQGPGLPPVPGPGQNDGINFTPFGGDGNPVGQVEIRQSDTGMGGEKLNYTDPLAGVDTGGDSDKK